MATSNLMNAHYQDKKVTFNVHFCGKECQKKMDVEHTYVMFTV